MRILGEYVGLGFTTSLLWILSFGGLAFFVSLLISRASFLQKPVKRNARDMTLSDESIDSDKAWYCPDSNPKEDFIYGVLRRINSGLTF